jgi:single-stranded DNA-binding protein
MKRVNNFEITGNCVADAKIITCKNGKQKAMFGIAVNYYGKNQAGEDESVVEFYNIETWKTSVFELLTKGTSLIVKGFRTGRIVNGKPYFSIVSNSVECFTPDKKS